MDVALLEANIPNDAPPTPLQLSRLPPTLLCLPQYPFPHHTIGIRVPDMISPRIRALNDKFPTPETNAQFFAPVEEIADELRNGFTKTLRPIAGKGPEVERWNQILAPHIGKPYFSLPWFVVEAYFYRRILEGLGYFDPDHPGYKFDPFFSEKLISLRTSDSGIQMLVETYFSRIHKETIQPLVFDSELFAFLLHHALWGNRVDLSMLGAGAHSEAKSQIESEKERENLLVDDTNRVLSYLVGKAAPGSLQGNQGNQTGLYGVPIVRLEREAITSPVTIQFINDNSGMEFICDLVLALYLIDSGIASHVRLTLKPFPYFVSDATRVDLDFTLHWLSKHENIRCLELGRLLQDRIAAGKISVHGEEEWFWASPELMWDMPSHVRAELSQADLVIFKGDLNYRRIMGNLMWAHDTPVDWILRYMPSPTLALRTCKGPVAVGLAPGQDKEAEAKDPEWMNSGIFGMIQLAFPNRS
eukprot:TRINITY_DN7621_c0_g1_i2.p1 TRINITY_DN7621_c0_g1~~TRINITY_DN7621_c0_g1_i2.p1  ORF type:complete len:472 (+),score=93.65 TRINITY_DN7621_c0_g1_i2:71-1486(+)